MAVVEKKSACSLLSRHMLSCRKLGPPALKNIKGMMTTAAKIMAINCAKSVMTEARNPDHKVRSEERRVGKECRSRWGAGADAKRGQSAGRSRTHKSRAAGSSVKRDAR